jgi:hypothetical protein
MRAGFEEDVMNRYFKTHRWEALAGAVVLIVLVAAACGGSSKQAPDKPPSGVAPGSPSGGTSLPKSASGAPAPDMQFNAANGAEVAGSSAAAAAPAGAGGTSSNDSAGTSGGAPNALPPTLDRKIIQTATLEITTDEVSKKFEDAGNIAAAAGGFIASSSFGTAGEKQSASITIRVPGENYQRALTDLRKLGDVKGEQSSANDVTEQYTDLQSRLRNLKATETQYLQFLSKAQNINDVLTVQDRLNATRAEIEQVQGRIDLVQHQKDLATITVHLDPPVVAKAEEPKKSGTSTPLEVAADSFRASLAVLLGIATVGLAVAAFSWWIVPLAVGGALLLRRQLRVTRERQAAPPAASPMV